MTQSFPVPAATDGRRVAIVHDWLTGMRGGEKVLEAIRALVPGADLLTLVHQRGTVSPALEAARPRPSFIQWLPGAHRYYRRYIPLFPMAVELFDLDKYDLVISTSHCAVKAVVPPGRVQHLCYCFTPMRYAWDQFDAYFGRDRVGRLRHWVYGRIFRRLARWDAGTARRVHRFVAISRYVADRIRRYYNRQAAVVYPPVDTDFFRPDGSTPGPYFLVVSALVPYKRIERAIEACRLARVSLRVIGDGPDRRRLERMADSSVRFMGHCSDDEVRAQMRGARGLLLPGEEDFGIAPVEAMACGRPVVALARGGAAETVEHEATGILVEDDSAAGFADGITRASVARFDPAYVRSRTLRFSYDRFHDEMRASIEAMLAALEGSPT